MPIVASIPNDGVVTQLKLARPVRRCTALFGVVPCSLVASAET